MRPCLLILAVALAIGCTTPYRIGDGGTDSALPDVGAPPDALTPRADAAIDANTTDANTDAFVGTDAGPTPTTFSYTGSIATYVVPSGVTMLHVVADGASGGAAMVYASSTTVAGGFGAHVDAMVPVTGGQSISVLVGQQPPPAPADPATGSGHDACGGNGGGGTFVVRGTTALVVAGGGGGGYANGSGLVGGDASLTMSGGSAASTAGGTGGAGGGGTPAEGGGGGGLTGDGGTGANGTTGGTGGRSFTNGGAGGVRASDEGCGTIPGGFGGGGGGGNDWPGGGGGYSGGAAANYSPSATSGGGGSFGPSGATITLRTMHGSGSVTITPM